MSKSQHSLDEILRLKELRSLDLLDSPSEKDFDELVDLAALICGCPISLITLVDEDRQWFKAKLGLEFNQTEREVSFCSHAILQQEDVFIVENTLTDKRFKDFPNVTGGISIRFYAGAPIYSPGGAKIGTICVSDRRTRILLPKQQEALRKLANQVTRLIDLRVKTRALEQLKSEKGSEN